MKKSVMISAVAAVCCWLVFFANQALSVSQGNLVAESGGPNKHNLSATRGVSQYKAVTETQVCVFCHTPHRALTEGPLWNHNLSAATYQVSLPGGGKTQLSTPRNPPDGDSRLCLSCHDGTVPLGAVQNLGGQSLTINMGLVGAGPLTGASVIGTNLSGHHLVSIEINDQLNTDKASQCPSQITWTVKKPVNIPADYMKKTSNVYGAGGTGKGVQCSSCHDPHMDINLNSKFLRNPSAGAWGSVAYADTLCTSCHCDCSGGPCQ